MSEYQDAPEPELDPFSETNQPEHFFAGGGRREILEEILDCLGAGENLLLVTGPLGSGKSTLAHFVMKSRGGGSVGVRVQSTLFMNESGVLNEICADLGLPTDASGSTGQVKLELLRYAGEVRTRGGTLVLLIDDSHELGSEVLQVLLHLAGADASGNTGIHLVLLGESQLNHMVSGLLPDSGETIAIGKDPEPEVFELQPFNRDTTADYLRFKLAGYSTGPMPFGKRLVSDIHARAGGIPGAVNRLARDTLRQRDEDPLSGTFRIPMPYVAAAGALSVALLAAIFLFDGSPGPEITGETGRIQVPLDTGSRNPPTPVIASRESPPVSEAAAADNAPTPDSPEGEARLLAMNPEHFALQILGTFSESGVRDFVSARTGAAEYSWFETRYQSRPWFVVVYGDFPTREAAVSAAAGLPLEVRELQPWARPLAGIQHDIKSR
ncbi:MAG: AAA family ATPase [Pseudohongiellaceae bacterium]